MYSIGYFWSNMLEFILKKAKNISSKAKNGGIPSLLNFLFSISTRPK